MTVTAPGRLSLVSVVVLASGCGGTTTSSSSPATPESSPTAASSAPPASSPTDEPTAAPPAIVGLWTQRHSCAEVQRAMIDEGLEESVPATAVEYFPGRSVAQVARKPDPCAGAVPEQHSHFFAADGQFGSLDQHGQRVDDGSWTLLGSHRLQIGEDVFAFTIKDDALTLRPVITEADRRAALRRPLAFGEAVWQVSVAYAGKPWRRADCGAWCD